MSDTLQQNPQPAFLHRIRHTRWQDILRGRVSGSLDVRHAIAASALPQDVKDLIAGVVKRTRLWRTERIEVAGELMSHFAEGIASGETSDTLTRSFGDPARAAQLIRRAKKRNRPLSWKTLRAMGIALTALLVVYVGVGVYYFAGHPTLSVDYVAQLNSPALSVPEAQRAWPIYRQAILGLGIDRSKNDLDALSDILDARPRDASWPKTERWLSEHAAAIDLFRQGTRKPVLGFILGGSGSASDAALWPHYTGPQDPNPPLIFVLLPYLHELQRGSEILAADGRAARVAGNRERFMQDVLAMRDMARQLTPDAFLVSQLVALHMRDVQLDEIEHALLESPGFLTEHDLRDLAHQLSDVQKSTDLVRARGERLWFYDAMQRAYTDDGHGDGRLTAEGLAKLTTEWTSPNAARDRSDVLELAAGPAAMLGMASRRDMLAAYDEIMDLNDAELAKPMREVTHHEADARVRQLQDSIAGKLRHLPLLVFVPSLQRAHVVTERYMGRRDGIVTAIALELYRRRSGGTYPASLDALVPALLPAVPTDRITGEPVHYKLIHGKPRVYSVGADRNDDNGNPPMQAQTLPVLERAAEWNVKPSEAADGDWPLFPQPEKPRPTTAANE